MTFRMDSQTLGQLMDEIQALRAAGKEAEAKQLLMTHMRELPEETQGEILLAMFTDGLEGEEADWRAMRDMQEKGLAVAKVLEKEKKSAIDK